jgi:hypothetical protein
MNINFHDFFVDKALEFKDYEWLQKLQKDKYEQLDKGTSNNGFYKTISALEDINSQYSIKDKNGLRNINWNSDYDIEYGEIVYLEKESYRKYDLVRYKDLTELESYYVRGYIKGIQQNYSRYYHDGYKQGYLEGTKVSDGTVKFYHNFVKDLKEMTDKNIYKNVNKKWYQFWK